MAPSPAFMSAHARPEAFFFQGFDVESFGICLVPAACRSRRPPKGGAGQASPTAMQSGQSKRAALCVLQPTADQTDHPEPCGGPGWAQFKL